MKVTSAALIGIFSFLSLYGCYYDSEEALYPEIITSCDTVNVSFNGSVVHILESNCYSCHSGSTSSFGGGINLQDKSIVITNASKIKASISQTGSKPMPPSGKLSSCDISRINIWIRNGMSI
jgi:uncharacterized membrane protein